MDKLENDSLWCVGTFGRHPRKRLVWVIVGAWVGLSAALSPASEPISVGDLAEGLRRLSANVLSETEREKARDMISDDLGRRIRKANRRSTADWGRIQSRRDWERFRDVRLRRLRESLGVFPEVSGPMAVKKSGELSGEGYRIEKLVFESRPGLWVTAHLYKPSKSRSSMPGILICHSHHAPKEHGELQDMGMTWARQGCLVLIPDMLGHGERRQHPFRTEADYRRPYRVGRQDYYFRYDMGIQLHLVGESLMGFFVWDLSRCVDVLLSQPGIDPRRIILMGAVAGGGDPAAVTAALDRRIQAAVPFNFGGPQPETRFPLPEDAESTFNYAGSGSFESTRNLQRSAEGGFLPWVIVGAIAPRRLVYAHEFSWDRPHDPVWQRLQKIYTFYGAERSLAYCHGHGLLKGRPPEASHCGNIGRVHRTMIHPAFKRWFNITVTDATEYSARRETDELRCVTPELEKELSARKLCDVLSELAAQRVAAARRQRAGQSPEICRRMLRESWSGVLGGTQPGTGLESRVIAGPQRIGEMRVERIVLHVEPGIVVPTILLLPKDSDGRRVPVTVAVAEGGKGAFLRHRSGQIAELLAGGVGVCLPDLRGQGESKPEGSRERWGAMTAHSSTELMLGGTILGARLRDLRSILQYLRGRDDVDADRLALWGDSFAPANPPGTDFAVPRNVDGRPQWAEPLGGLLALLGALFEDDVCAVYASGGLSDFHSVLQSQFVYIPHDVVIPGVLCTGDLCDVAAALAPRPLRLDELVDGFNRLRSEKTLQALYQPAMESYRQLRAPDRLGLGRQATSPAHWLLEQLREQ